MSSEKMTESGRLETGQTSAVPLQRTEMLVRPAVMEDAGAISAILVEAFPGLFRMLLGPMVPEQTAALLEAIYQAGHLSLETTLVCERDGSVAGVAILHTGEPLEQGTVQDYCRLHRRHRGLLALLPALFGLINQKLMNRRIPHAPDLVYIEALAVREEARGCGVGTDLLAAIEEWAGARRRTRIALHVLYSRVEAKRLYRRHGYAAWRPIPLQPLTTYPTRTLSLLSASLLMKRLDVPPPERPERSD